jgi:hypothetical protein
VWWRRTDEGGLHIVVKAQFDSYAVLKAGAPKALWTEIRWVGVRAVRQMPLQVCDSRYLQGSWLVLRQPC